MVFGKFEEQGEGPLTAKEWIKAASSVDGCINDL